MPGPPSGQYSTNPSTIKSRARKMSLSGAGKVEEAARTADYKAMIYARKIYQAKPEYIAASKTEQAAMIERTMRETMDKRRAKGQDTISKMAAFNAGDPRALRAGIVGHSTHVPVSKFLESNGFIPARSDAHRRGQGQREGAGGGFNPVPGVGSPRPSSTNNSLFLSSPVQSDHSYEASTTPAPFANMTPEPMESIESSSPDEVTRLRNEVHSLRNMCQNVLDSNNNNSMRDHEVRNMREEMGADYKRLVNHEERLGHLEAAVSAMQDSLMPSITGRVDVLEGLTEQLKVKIGDGYDAELARMREVFGSLRQAMARVGNFI